jgi:hypothetical protein
MAYGVRIRDARWLAKPPEKKDQANKPLEKPTDSPDPFSGKPAGVPVVDSSSARRRQKVGEPLKVRRFWNYFDVHR